jgi:hypothetical protein
MRVLYKKSALFVHFSSLEWRLGCAKDAGAAANAGL